MAPLDRYIRLYIIYSKRTDNQPEIFHHDLPATLLGSHVTIGEGRDLLDTDYNRGFVHSGGGNNYVGQWEPKSYLIFIQNTTNTS